MLVAGASAAAAAPPTGGEAPVPVPTLLMGATTTDRLPASCADNLALFGSIKASCHRSVCSEVQVAGGLCVSKLLQRCNSSLVPGVCALDAASRQAVLTAPGLLAAQALAAVPAAAGEELLVPGVSPTNAVCALLPPRAAVVARPWQCVFGITRIQT